MSTSFYAYKKSKNFNDAEYLEGLQRCTRLDPKLRSLIEAEADFKALHKSYDELDEEEFEALSWQPKVDKYLREAEEFDFFQYWGSHCVESYSLDDIRASLKINRSLIKKSEFIPGQGSLEPVKINGAIPPENFPEVIRLIKTRSDFDRKDAELLAFFEEFLGKDFYVITG